MDILVAINNNEIKEKISKIYGTRVYTHDILYKEDVISYLEKNNDSHIIITKLNLSGIISYKEYIIKLKEINRANKIIILVDKLDKKDKEFLFANEIFNIIEGNEINIDLICKQIETNNKVIYKTIYENKNLNKNKRSIVVFGTDGSGKSTMASFISKIIAKYAKGKVVLITLDSKNPCIDIINNTTCINYDVKTYLDDISNNSNNIYKYINKSSDYKNLWYINTDTKIGFSNFNVECDNIIKNLSIEFDYVILDFPNYTLDNSFREFFNVVDELLFVINPNYISLRQAKKYLEYMCVTMNVSSNKINLLINKYDKYSLDVRQIKSVLNNFNKHINIRYIKEVEAYINGIIYEFHFGLKEESKLLDFLNIEHNKKKYLKNTYRKVE